MAFALAFEKDPACTDGAPRSSAPPAFLTENKLVSAFEKTLKRIPEYRDWTVLREFDAADGIADVIFFELSRSLERVHSLGDVPPRWAYALRSLPYRENFSLQDFTTWTGVTARHAGFILDHFHQLGFLQPEKERNTWMKVQRPQLLSTRIHAFEAKLRDWKRALRQAYRYRDYACQTWVLLDASSVGPAISNLDQFARLNVGLVALSSDGHVMTYFQPQTSLPRSAIRFWQANAVIAHRLQSGF
jgi:hypothetical protein